MYYNDPYDINNENDDDNDFTNDNYNTIDKGYNKIKQKVDGKYKYIEYYKTPNRPGAIIRNAITGLYTNIMVGSIKEDLYYKVNITAGQTDKNNPSVLFFDNPEQFENHFYCNVSKKTKDAWKIKNTNAILKNK